MARQLKTGDEALSIAITPRPLSESGKYRIRTKPPKIILDKSYLLIRERDGSLLSESGYSVRLSIQPALPVIVDIGNHDTDCLSVSPNILVFTPENYAHRQKVSVISLFDGSIEDKNTQIVHTIRNNESYGASFEALPVYVVNSNKEPLVIEAIPGIVLDESQDLGCYVKSGLDKGRIAYNIRLRSQPDDDVVISVSSSDLHIKPLLDTIVFTPHDWSDAREILVDIPDSIDTISCVLTHVAMGGRYSGVKRELSLITAQNRQIVRGNVIYNNKTPHVRVDDKEITGSFQIRLTEPPIGDVLIGALDIDSNTIEVFPDSLLFDGSNWNRNRKVSYRILLPTATYTGTGYFVQDGDYELAENSIIINRIA